LKIIFVILLNFLILLPLIAQEKLTFSTFENKGQVGDICLKVLIKAYKMNGIEVNVKTYPAARALLVSNDGKDTDGELFRISGMNKTYSNLIEIPITLSKLDMFVFTKKHFFKIKNWDSLKPYHIGILRGCTFSEKNTVGMKRTVIKSIDQLFLMLDSGKVDVVVRGLSGKKILSKLSLKNITMLKNPIDSNNLFHYLHKKHKKIIPKITKTLKKMQKEGEIKKFNNDSASHNQSSKNSYINKNNKTD